LGEPLLEVIHDRLQGGGRIELQHLAGFLVDQRVARREEVDVPGLGNLVGPVGAGVDTSKPTLEDVAVVRARTSFRAGRRTPESNRRRERW
jgi:hypothetical protein